MYKCLSLLLDGMWAYQSDMIWTSLYHGTGINGSAGRETVAWKSIKGQRGEEGGELLLGKVLGGWV